MSKMEPGVVYGAKYEELLQSCKDGGYALPAVNVVGSNSINAVMEAAAKNESDIIIQLSNGGAQFMAGQGMADSDAAKVVGAVAAANHVHLLEPRRYAAAHRVRPFIGNPLSMLV